MSQPEKPWREGGIEPHVIARLSPPSNSALTNRELAEAMNVGQRTYAYPGHDPEEAEGGHPLWWWSGLCRPRRRAAPRKLTQLSWDSTAGARASGGGHRGPALPAWFQRHVSATPSSGKRREDQPRPRLPAIVGGVQGCRGSDPAGEGVVEARERPPARWSVDPASEHQGEPGSGWVRYPSSPADPMYRNSPDELTTAIVLGPIIR